MWGWIGYSPAYFGAIALLTKSQKDAAPLITLVIDLVRFESFLGLFEGLPFVEHEFFSHVYESRGCRHSEVEIIPLEDIVRIESLNLVKRNRQCFTYVIFNPAHWQWLRA